MITTDISHCQDWEEAAKLILLNLLDSNLCFTSGHITGYIRRNRPSWGFYHREVVKLVENWISVNDYECGDPNGFGFPVYGPSRKEIEDFKSAKVEIPKFLPSLDSLTKEQLIELQVQIDQRISSGNYLV